MSKVRRAIPQYTRGSVVCVVLVAIATILVLRLGSDAIVIAVSGSTLTDPGTLAGAHVAYGTAIDMVLGEKPSAELQLSRTTAAELMANPHPLAGCDDAGWVCDRPALTKNYLGFDWGPLPTDGRALWCATRNAASRSASGLNTDLCLDPSRDEVYVYLWHDGF